MYEHPEPAFEERESSARLARFLGDQGFNVEYPAYGLETSFAARAGTAGPEVIICAEYDALPGVGHACGHNIIATAAAGAGVALAGMADQLGIRVTVLGTPAEEKYSGKVDLINAGAFEGAAASMMIHPADDDTVDPRVLAVNHLIVEYRGKTAHAAASPWEGLNALDAFVQAYVNTATLRQAMYPTDKVHCMITHGGDAPNIIPSYTRSEWYVRAATDARLQELMARVQACFDAAASATGCTVEVSQSGHPMIDLISNPLLTDLYLANTTALGRPMQRGADRDPSKAGSTDMGNVSHVVPSIHPMLDIHPDGAVNHQPEFAAHTITPDGDRAIRDGALAMAWTIVDLAEGDRWSELGT
ncbi:MAG: M20 family metallopeptidase [Actinobacteria bacterium]|nr:M20 family metallopeptidase [Actinomycetota bacterium]MBU1493571.1 M20 family metallopeptidase [Actinomycetota bacterium]